MNSDAIWKYVYYYCIGYQFSHAVKMGDSGELFFVIAVLFVGLVSIFPVYKPEEK